MTGTDGWADRVRGALLGAALGDAVGAPFEGAAAVDPAALRAWLAAPQPLRWTDDTALLLALAGHLARHRGTLDQDRLAADFTAAWAADPDRGYGPGALRLFARLGQGAPWRQATTELFGGAGSLGNGAAMRVAPVALLRDVSGAHVAGLARRSAAVTHAHPLGQDGAVAQAVAVRLAAGTATAPDPEEFAAAVAGQVETEPFAAALRAVPALVRRGADAGRVAAELGADATALRSVPAALAAFLRHPDDPAAVVTYAVSMGGDADTVAAMAGALAGARCGAAALPESWLVRLEDAPRLRAAADAVAALPPAPSP